MLTTTALDFQNVIPQNDESNLCPEGGENPERKRPAASADFAQVSGLS